MPRPKTRRTPDTSRKKKLTVKPKQKAKAAATVAPEAESETKLPQMSVRGFAALFDVSPDTVSRWCALGMPHEQPGKQNAGYLIDPAKACPWVRQSASEPPKESQRERLAREQADKAARENAEARGELVDAGVVDETFRIFAKGLADQFKTITNRCSHEFAGITDPQRIRERFTEEFGNAGEVLADQAGKLASACEKLADYAGGCDTKAAALAGPMGGRESETSEG